MHCSHCSTVIDILEELTREMRAVQFPLSSRVSRKDCRPYPVGILTFGEFFFYIASARLAWSKYGVTLLRIVQCFTDYCFDRWM